MRSGEPRAERVGTFEALRHRDYRLLFTGLVGAGVGNTMQGFALGWLVVELAIRDGNPQLGALYLGLVGFTRSIPGLVAGLFAGVAADRVDRRRLLLVTQAGSVVIAGALAGLTLADRINVVWIMGLNVIAAVTASFDPPARQSLMTRMVPRRALVSAIGLNSLTYNGASLVGPLIGGVLIAPIGIGGVLLVNTVMHLPAVALLLAIGSPPQDRASGTEGVLRSIAQGFAYIWETPALRWTIVLTCASALGVRPFQQLMPAVVHDVYRAGPIELSWLLSASGAGSVVGAFVVASLGGVRRLGVLLCLAGALAAAADVAFAAQRSVLVALLPVVLISCGSTVFMNMSSTISQLTTPDRLRGRITGLQQMTLQAFSPLGAMVLGTLATFVGVDVALMCGGGAVILLCAFVLSRVLAVRDFGRETALATVPRPAP